MALIEDLAASAGSTDAPVKEVITGPCWVMVTAAGSGVAARIAPVEGAGTQGNAAQGNAAGAEANNLSGPGPATGLVEEFRNRPLGDLIGLASSPDRFKASLGVAALNAALSAGRRTARPRSSAIPRAGGKTVAVIGDFTFIEDLRRIADRVIMIPPDPDAPAGLDAVPRRDGPVQAPDEALAGADIAIVRGSTLMAGTLESWLDRAAHCYTVVYGPSTPLSPVLFDYGADQLVGITVGIDDVAAGWIKEGRDNLLACPGIKSVVIGRDQR